MSKFLDASIMARNQGHYNFPTFENNKYGSRDNFGPLTVPENSFFMMGDNRDRSSDSRQWGFVNYEHIVGEALIIYFSWDGQYPFLDLVRNIRFSRIGTVIR